MFDIRKIQEQVIFSAVTAASDAQTATYIISGDDGSGLSEDNAQWVRSTMHRLETHFDVSVVKQIRMACQCGYGMEEKLSLIRELMVGVTSLEEFASKEKAKAAGLFSTNGELFLQFPYCPCPMLADVTHLETDTWCQCTTGYSKVLFEKAFGCGVDVELLKSVKRGDEICLMKIIPAEPVWK